MITNSSTRRKLEQWQINKKVKLTLVWLVKGGNFCAFKKKKNDEIACSVNGYEYWA